MIKNNLSPFEYLLRMQVEWLCADIRSKIYKRISDKNYWNRVKDHKKKTIDEIAERNNLATIFTDPQRKEFLLKTQLYDSNGMPVFIYKDEEHRLQLEHYDLYNYYRPSTFVVYFDPFTNEQREGKIRRYKSFDKLVLIQDIYNKNKLEVPITSLRRII